MISVIDLAIRIKNGYLAKKEEVLVPASKIRVAVLEKLVSEGFISSFEQTGVEGRGRTVKIVLKYEKGKPAFTDAKIISKPGQRVYVGSHEIPSVLNGLGIAILSTTKGIMTGKESRKAGLGGELLFTIW